MSESQHVEWKESWRDEYLKWVCGFANADGGVLVIGRNDKGEAVGIVDARQLLETIPNKVRDLLGIIVDVNLYEEDGKQLLEIVVEPYPYPISYKGQYHYRSGSTKQELKGAALDRFLLRKQGKHWDGVPVPYVAVDDLADMPLQQFRALALRSKRLSSDILDENNSLLIEKLHLMDGQYLKRAAILLFHPDPEKYVTGAYVKIGFFRTDADLLYHDEVHGDLFSQVNQTIDLLLTKYFRAMISYDGLQRVETYPIPEAALREAVLNAIIHKDYASGAPVQISVYEDRLMIWNSGQLPESWDIETLLHKHSSKPYNPDIANAFFRAGMIESWGRGIERINQACADAEVALPEFRYEHSDLWAVFSFATPDEASEQNSKKIIDTTTQETTQKTTQKVLFILKDNPSAGRKEIAAILGDITEDGVKYQLNKMKKKGLIKRVGPDKGGYWEVLEAGR